MYRNFVQTNNNAATISTTTNTAIPRTNNVAILGKERQNTFFDNHRNTKNREKDNLSKDCYRPTYGAYIYNSLPRGPYLQYKINDQQYTARKTLSEDNDNNEQQQHLLQQQQHQQQKYLKSQHHQPGESSARNSSTLPRAKLNMAGDQGDCRTFCKPQNNAIKLPQNSGLDAQIAQQDNRNRRLEVGSGTDCMHNQADHRSNRAELQNKQRLTALNERTAAAAVTKGYQTLPHRISGGPARDAAGCRNNETECSAKRIPVADEPEIKSGQLNYLRTAPASGNDFLKQIQEKNSDMLARIAAAAVGQHFWAPHRPNPPPLLPAPPLASGAVSEDERDLARRAKLPPNGRSLCDLNYSSSSAQVNFVTLADVIRVRSEGLSELEGWALLCQSVQALQDLFLADTPSTSRIIPLVRPSTVQITSRGRVVFSLISTSQFNKLIDAISYFDITCQLSPEYVRSIGKKTMFAESDIEKMWIYSLGMTLRQGIKYDENSTATRPCNLNANAASDQNTLNSQLGAIDNLIRPTTIRPQPPAIVGGFNGYAPGQKQVVDLVEDSLDKVITCMCEQNLQQRASLMYLLDVISTFCRSQQQAKPFSHIAMDIFREVVSASQREKPFKAERNQYADEIKSETDSGRGSTHGDKDILSGVEPIVPRLNDLKVFNKKGACDADCDKYGRVEYGRPEYSQDILGHPLVFRRQSKQFIQKTDFRRKTIDVNLFDLEKARQEMATNKLNEDCNISKSTTFIDKIVAFGENDLKTAEYHIEDLIPRKTVSVANLKVRRQESRKLEYLTKAYSEESFLMKAKGPEFIVKSSLPSREINICKDSKCQHVGVVNVLLLDGQTIHISCNTLSTTAGELFKTIVKSERYAENYFLGVCALIGGDFVFLPADLKVYKVAPQNWANKSNKLNNTRNIFFTLFLRVKFFLPTLRGISSLESRHMMYLQLRKSILEKHILCTEDDLIFLGGLALQAEIGDFKESMKYNEYFTISHYLPEGVYHRNKEMGKYLRNSHYCRQGIHPTEAEQNFIKYVQEMKEYGFHLYSGVWTRDDDRMIDVYVGISLAGIVVFERNHNHRTNAANNSKTSYQRKLFASFEWPEIENLCFSKHILCIAVRKTESLKAKDNNRIKYKLRMDGRKSYFAFSLASEHHQFYMKLRNSFISLKSLSDELNIPITSPCQADKRADGMEMYGIVPEPPVAPSSNGLPENIKKIDKQLKVSAAVRVRNLKKSMLNDNRLLKLKEKFLRRSKSTVGVSGSGGGGESRKKFDGKDKDKSRDMNNLRIEQHAPSMEESQNKENECPRAHVDDVSPKVYSPNRNRVKMGTRVFSSQFLNKSYDNIYERSLNGQQFRSTGSVDNSNHEDVACDELDPPEGDFYILSRQDDHSMKSASFSSLCGVNKLPESPQHRLEAYVIHSSIRSDRNSRCNFSLPNETISDSLLEKFNNMSCNNTVNDRLLTKLTIVKERFNTSSRDKRDHTGLGRDSTKYASPGRRTPSEVLTAAVVPYYHYSRWDEPHLKNRNGNGKDFENIANRRPQLRGALWQLSRSQESIFIDNKFPMRNDTVNQASMENDLDGFTLGISIVQGSDNNVYVKHLVKDGPGERAGIQIGDQIIAVNGISLLNLSYEQSLDVLQNTGQVVHLIVSQIARRTQNNKSYPPYHPSSNPKNVDLSPTRGSSAAKKVINSEKPPKPITKGRSKSINVTTTTTSYHGYLEDAKFPANDIYKVRYGDSDHLEMCPIPFRAGTAAIGNSNSIRDNIHDNSQFTGEKFKSARIGNKVTSHTLTPAKSLPDLPKVVAIIPKRSSEQKQADSRKIPIPRTLGSSRKYLGPLRYPVTPIKTVLTPVKHHLSLLADSDDDQVFI